MSTTVTYNGSEITVVDNATKTLETAGMWLAGDITLTDVTSSIATKTVTTSSDSTTISFSVNAEPETLFLFLPSGTSKGSRNLINKVVMSVVFDGSECVGQYIAGQINTAIGDAYSAAFDYYYSKKKVIITIPVSYCTFPAGTWNVIYSYRS